MKIHIKSTYLSTYLVYCRVAGVVASWLTDGGSRRHSRLCEGIQSVGGCYQPSVLLSAANREDSRCNVCHEWQRAPSGVDGIVGVHLHPGDGCYEQCAARTFLHHQHTGNEACRCEGLKICFDQCHDIFLSMHYCCEPLFSLLFDWQFLVLVVWNILWWKNMA